MSESERFRVPLTDLDAVHVAHTAQVAERAESRAPESSQWNRTLPPVFGDGATSGDADGE